MLRRLVGRRKATIGGGVAIVGVGVGDDPIFGLPALKPTVLRRSRSQHESDCHPNGSLRCSTIPFHSCLHLRGGVFGEGISAGVSACVRARALRT